MPVLEELIILLNRIEYINTNIHETNRDYDSLKRNSPFHDLGVTVDLKYSPSILLQGMLKFYPKELLNPLNPVLLKCSLALGTLICLNLPAPQMHLSDILLYLGGLNN